MNRFVYILLSLIWIGLVVLVASAGRLNAYYNSPALRQAAEEVVEIKAGLNLAQVARRLNRLGIIRRPELFRVAVRLSGLARRVRSGEYYLSASMSPAKVLEVLTSGPPALHRVTIPEGSTMAEVAQILDKARLVREDEFMTAAKSRHFLDSLGISGATAEGYLFPDTYHLPRGLTARAVIRIMVDRFREIYNQIKEKRPQTTRLSEFETVTLASLVEAEVIKASEGPIVASVYTNRLKKNMRLQCDPTVIYGLDDFNGVLTKRQLKIDHPYNTYIHYGLPPGPINNPGRSALEAALAPAETDYYYFVAKGDGSHQFSQTYAEHLAAIRKIRSR